MSDFAVAGLGRSHNVTQFSGVWGWDGGGDLGGWGGSPAPAAAWRHTAPAPQPLTVPVLL